MLLQVNLDLFLYVLTFLPIPYNNLPVKFQAWSEDSSSVLDHKHGLEHAFDNKFWL